MPTKEEIQSLISRMPDLDAAPPEEKKDPTAPPQPRDPRAPKGKLTGPPWPQAEEIYTAILTGGKDSISAVIDLITENDIGPAYKPRYVLHGLAVYACRSGKEKERAAIIAAILPQLTSGKPKTTRGFLVRTLQTFADPAVIPALAPLLADEDLADAAAAAMVTLALISEGPKTAEASQVLRDAFPKSPGRPRLAIIQALGVLKDRASIEALTQAAGDKDENTQITALWSLARTADPAAIEPILKAADAPEGWARTQAVKAAFSLAESFAAAGQKENAGKIYDYLRKSRTDDHETFVKEAAERGLNALK